ncbi:MAG: arylsulfatase [Akkermansiaceae bacterium]|nr:arylsulfatase [Akkermansiaceae bacterium]
MIRFLLLVSVLTAGAPLSAAPRPHVVLIMTDDQGYGDLACLGNPIIKTPHLDRIHGESVRLTNFHVNPACAPTRAALMTGRTAHRAGVWHVVMGRTMLHPDEVTMAEVFRDGGYRTAMFGKWHLGDNYPFRPQDQGFAEVLTHGGGVIGHTPDYWMNDYFDDHYLHNGKWEKQDGYCTDVWIDHGIRFLESHREKPCFVYLPLNAPHGPFEVPERFAAMYRGNPEVPHAEFYGMITAIDEAVGRLDAALERMGIRDDTILIFLTDNGTSAGIKYRRKRAPLGFDAGMRGKKGSPYDGGHRVPCFVRWPGGGLDGGRDVGRITAHYDLLPTLMELCGIHRANPPRFDGMSLAPLLRGGRKDSWPERTLVTEMPLTVGTPGPWSKTCVMTDRWRLVNRDELYDVAADPGQKRNVAADHPEVVQGLAAWYERYYGSLAEARRRECRIPLGVAGQGPALLTSYHWNNESGEQRDMPWAHHHIVAGPLQNGFWRVDVARAGTYAVRLRRWPAESGLKINEHADHLEPPEKPWHPLEPAQLTAVKARVRIGEAGRSAPVPADAAHVELRVQLGEGPARLQTWFEDARGRSRGAYYVDVERLLE